MNPEPGAEYLTDNKSKENKRKWTFFLLSTLGVLICSAFITGVIVLSIHMIYHAGKETGVITLNSYTAGKSYYDQHADQMKQAAVEMMKSDGLVMLTNSTAKVNDSGYPIKPDFTTKKINGVWAVYVAGSKYDDNKLITNSSAYKLVKDDVFEGILFSNGRDIGESVLFRYIQNNALCCGFFYVDGGGGLLDDTQNDISDRRQINDEWYWFSNRTAGSFAPDRKQA